MKTSLIIASIVAVLLAASTGAGFWLWSDVRAELTSTEAELASTEADLAVTEADLAVTEAELSELKEVYPPRHFETYSELEECIERHTPIDESAGFFRACLTLQALVLADGYVFSAFKDIDNTHVCMAIAGDSVYWVWPDGTIQWIAYR